MARHTRSLNQCEVTEFVLSNYFSSGDCNCTKRLQSDCSQSTSYSDSDAMSLMGGGIIEKTVRAQEKVSIPECFDSLLFIVAE